MSFWDNIFGGGNNNNNKTNPANAAMPYYNQIPGMENNNYNPYIQRGNDAYNNSNPTINEMSSDPAGFLQKLMGGYTASKDYQMKNDAMTRSAGNSAAAGGMRGSLDDIKNQAGISDSLLGNDMQNWLTNVLGVQKTGLQGEQNLQNQGYNASNALTGDLSNVMGTQGSLAFQGQTNQNQNHSDMMSLLTKLGAGGAGWFFGGPQGASAVSKFF